MNILTALADNVSMVKNNSDAGRKAIALARSFTWLATYTSRYTQRSPFTVDYPKATEVGNEICIRVTQAGQPTDLHRFGTVRLPPVRI